MPSSNSFNVCPRCGKANALNAKYCSSCGQQLAVPQEVIVCHKCHKTNSPMASFCGACGAPLRVGAQTKICPRCHKEVDVNESSCSCGYSFGNVKYAVPESAASVASNRSTKVKTGKGGRAAAIISFLLVVLLAYLMFAPTTMRPSFLSAFDGGLAADDQGETIYGDTFVLAVISGLTDPANIFQKLSNDFGIGGVILVVLLAVTVICVVIQAITYFIRIFTDRKNKRKNLFYLLMAIITTLWVGFAFVFANTQSSEFLSGLEAVFTVSNCKIGYVSIVIPVYFWLFFIISVGNRRKKAKEDVA